MGEAEPGNNQPIQEENGEPIDLDQEEELETNNIQSLEEDLDSIDKMLDQMDRRNEHLKDEILSLLQDIRSEKQETPLEGQGNA